MTNSMPLEKNGTSDKPVQLCHDPVARLCEWLGHLLGFQVPVGYEDETGVRFEKNRTPLN